MSEKRCKDLDLYLEHAARRRGDERDGPALRNVAKGWDPLLFADVILALASSQIRLDLGGAVGIEIASPKISPELLKA